MASISIGAPSAQNTFPTVCNTSRVKDWNSRTYNGPLARVSVFWIYQTQRQIVLTQELALDLALANCKVSS